MKIGYKIKMDDGSLLGPMDLPSLEGWYKQGLVKHDNMVQRPGSFDWIPLSQVLAQDLRKAAADARKAAAPPAPPPQPARPRPAAAPLPRATPGGGATASIVKGLVAVLLLAAVAGGGLLAYTYVVERQKAPPEKPAATETSPEAAAAAAAQQQAKLVDGLVEGTPLLSRPAAELLLAQSGGRALDPAEAFRRAQVLVARGVASLSATDSRELGRYLQMAYDALTPRDRDRLTAYLGKVRAGATTKPEEDREMASVMKAGIAKMSADRRTKLQALFEKAMRAATAPRR